MRLATLLLKIPDNWMTQLLHDCQDVQIKVINCMPYKSQGGRGLMRLSSNKKLSDIIKDITRHRGVSKTRFFHVSERTAFGEVVIDRCAACMALRQSDCFLVSSKSKNKGWLEWDVIADSNDTVHDLICLLERNDCEVQLTRISASSGESGLTRRQDEILQFAYLNGYYDYPRRIQLRELSSVFCVSPSTMSEILRAGQRRVFSEYFRKYSG